jgi:superfamily I DNA and/or RNA helicase
MVHAKQHKASRVLKILGPSRWLHVLGSGSGKWCAEEGEIVLQLLHQLVEDGIDKPDLLVITPFRIVAQNMRSMLSASEAVRRITDRPWQWARDRVGTVHTVQGREAEAVLLVLGAPEEVQNGARSWAGYPPNLVNVAVSRAQEALYVIGNRVLWQKHGCFDTVSRRLVN